MPTETDSHPVRRHGEARKGRLGHIGSVDQLGQVTWRFGAIEAGSAAFLDDEADGAGLGCARSLGHMTPIGEYRVRPRWCGAGEADDKEGQGESHILIVSSPPP